MNPLTFALLVGAAAIIVWWEWPRTPLVAPSAVQVIIQSSPDAAEHRLCDHAVDMLLHSNDLVEVTRAGVIVHEIPCGIGRRL